jgi:hypothetical protein
MALPKNGRFGMLAVQNWNQHPASPEFTLLTAIYSDQQGEQADAAKLSVARDLSCVCAG